jgi:MFS family permease
MNIISRKKKKILLCLACCSIFFEAFDVSIVNLSLTTIAAGFHLPLADAQWIQTIYLISFGSFLLFGGRLVDAYGHKKIYLTGMGIFGAASAFAFMSASLPPLLLIRGLQGFGAALAMPAGIAMLSTYFGEGKERNTAFGIFGSFAALGFAMGLALGGIITAYVEWHWIFSINVPVFILILFTGILIPDDNPPDVRIPKYTSSLWLIVSLILLSYSTHELPVLQWKGIAGIGIALVSLYALVQFDRRTETPFFNKNIFTPAALKSQLCSVLLGAGFLSFVFIATLALSQEFNFDNKAIGFVLFPFSILSALVSKYLLPSLFTRTGVANTACIALTMLFIGSVFLLIVLQFHYLPLLFISIALVNSLSISMAYPALTILSLTGVKKENQGISAGMQSSLYAIGTSIGISVTGLFLKTFSSPAGNMPLFATAIFITLLPAAAILILMPRTMRIKNIM